jgi:excisionase family DNA binding protein
MRADPFPERPGDISSIPFDERLTCSVAEACSAVGLSRAMIYQLIAGGAVESLTIGRRRLIKVPSLKRLVDSRSVAQ